MKRSRPIDRPKDPFFGKDSTMTDIASAILHYVCPTIGCIMATVMFAGEQKHDRGKGAAWKLQPSDRFALLFRKLPSVICDKRCRKGRSTR